MQAPEGEGGVADPRVAVVPVALPAGRLRQRGRQRRDHSARGRVHQPLQRQCRALQLPSPAVIGELAPLEPAAPRLAGLVDPPCGVAGVARNSSLVGPGQRAVRVLVRAEPPDAPEAPVAELEVHVRLQAQRDVVDLGDRHAELAVELPVDRAATVVGEGVADELDLGVSLGAMGPADQHPLGLQPVAPVMARIRVDQQGVADDQPAGLGRPGRFDHVRAGFVAAGDRNSLVGREPQRAGGAVEQRAEEARRVEAG